MFLDDKYDKGHLFSYSSCGFIYSIKFNDFILWDGDSDERQWIDQNNDYEDLYEFCVRMFKNYIDDCMEIYKILSLK